MNTDALFSTICQKYKVSANDQKRLATWYDDLGESELYEGYAPFSAYIWECAKLIRLLKHGSEIKVSSAEGVVVSITDKQLQEALYRYANAALWEEYDIFASDEETKQLFPDDVLQRIIDNEEEKAAIRRVLRGKSEGVIFYLGYWASEGTFCLCETDLNKTQQNNLIGELIEASGALVRVKNKEWLAETWKPMLESQKSKEVQSWIKSYHKALDKLEVMPPYTA